jgi:hypothetical protein
MRHLRAACLAAAAVAACTLTSAYAETPFASPPPQTPALRPPIFRPVPGPVPRMEVVTDGGEGLPVFAHEGRQFLLGSAGDRYTIRLVNPTPTRIEAVVSVDGLDVLDGKTASLSKRGYVVPAFGTATIDGWRTSMDSVASFRFSSVRDSYAARTGGDRNVGVIGVACFRERPPAPVHWRAAVPPSAAGAAPAPSPEASRRSSTADGPARPGLGTQFGEAHDSRVEETSFVRADATPVTSAELRYDDRDGLVERGIPVPSRDPHLAEIELRDDARAFPDSRFADPPRW